MAAMVTTLGCVPGPARSTPDRAKTEPVWTYDVRAVGSPIAQLEIQAVFAPGAADSLEVDADAAPYVHDVEYESRGGWRAARRDARQNGAAWTAPCRADGCRVRYRFALSDAAAAIDDVDTAFAAGGLVVAPPSTWLLRPSAQPDAGRFGFRVHTDAGTEFATGVHAAPDGAPSAFEARVDEMAQASFAVFGAFHLETIRSGAARVDAVVAPSGLPLSRADAIAWIRTAVAGIAGYYGRFPVDRTLMIVVPGTQEETRGETLGDGGAAVLIRVGTRVTAATTRDDWVVTHELLHVTLPSLAREHLWLSEGVATYVEPIVRARAGLVTPERFWRDLVEGLPQGLPEPGDQGLERTHTWGRTYWGGALFCLLADVRIRQETHDARSLDDALRGIAATGADVQSRWDIAHVIGVGDAATGTTALAQTYRELALAPGSVELAELWKRLGVHPGKDGVTLDDQAPLAAMRRAITSGGGPD
jgi:hypothetical protein